MKTILAAMSAVATAADASPPSQTGVAGQIPPGYEILVDVHISAGRPARNFEIVALGRKDEEARTKSGHAPPRPLLIFERRGTGLVLAGRNDHIVLKADDGGQCDPFLDGDAVIAVKGRYFTVQNGVACGAHWTDYVTFRLDDRTGGFVFDNERQENWELNPSNDPNAEALVRAGPPRVTRDRAGHVTPFPVWHRPH